MIMYRNKDMDFGTAFHCSSGRMVKKSEFSPEEMYTEFLGLHMLVLACSGVANKSELNYSLLDVLLYRRLI